MGAVTGKQIIEKATKYLGYGGTKFWRDYGLPKGSHWCCAFVWDIFRMADASKLFYGGQKTAYVPTATVWLQATCKHIKMEDAKPGDIVVFTWSGKGYNKQRGSRDHIGFIRKAGNAKHAYTIEGNTGASTPTQTRVMERIREVKHIYGIYRPKYRHSNAWYLRRSTKKIMNYMERHDFKYRASWRDNAMTWAGAKKKKTANCSSAISWSFQEAGFLKKGEIFWINGKKIVCQGGLTLKDLKKIATISHPNKTPKKAHLRKGDVVGYGGKSPHTMEFAGWTKSGKPKWYSWSSSDKRDGKDQPMVKPSYTKRKIETIIRLKDK